MVGRNIRQSLEVYFVRQRFYLWQFLYAKNHAIIIRDLGIGDRNV